MFSRTMLALCLVLCSCPAVVQAALANLVRHYVESTPDGQSVVVCVYAADGKQFERRYPAGNFCPAYAEV